MFFVYILYFNFYLLEKYNRIRFKRIKIYFMIFKLEIIESKNYYIEFIILRNVKLEL